MHELQGMPRATVLAASPQDAGKSLLTALLELLICPPAKSFLLLELSDALEALVLAWGCAGADAHKSRQQPSSASHALVLAGTAGIAGIGLVTQQGGCTGPGTAVKDDVDWDWLCAQVS
jgi:hypothetical protein